MAMKNLKSKHNMPRKHTLLQGVGAGILAAALAGCGTAPAPMQDLENSKETALPHHVPNFPVVKKDAEGDRAKIYPGTGEVVKAPTATAKQPGVGELTLSFEGADLREVVKTVLSDVLKESYIMDPRVAGTITLHTKRPIPRSAVLPTLETVLKMSGAVLLRQDDGVYQVVPGNMAGKGNLTPRLGEIGQPLPIGYSIQVVPLKFIGAADMARLLEPVTPEPGAVKLDLMRNLLILSGTEPELRHMFETIDMFDVDWLAGMSVGLFTLQNVDVKTISGDLEKVFGDKGSGPLAGALRLVPIERLNALLVVTRQPRYIDQARTWIDRLDRAGAGGGGQRLYVYQVQNGKAEPLAALLNDAFGKKGSQKSASPTLAPGLKPAEVKSDAKDAPAVAPRAAVAESSEALAVPEDVRVIADKDSNALLILASAADYDKIEAALRKLDVVPRQVLIEVTIAEITLKDELSYGLEWFMKSGTRLSGQLDAGGAGIAKLAPGFSYSWISKSGDITAILNMLASDSRLEIISSPHITVADNQKASIQVGDRVPTITQTQTATTTNGVISSVQYLDTGVLLNVTPRVNASGMVTMEINQEISNASKTTSSTIDSPTIQRRTAQSTVTVQSGETLIMAGLIRDESNNSSDGLPGLSRLPLIGGLFGAKSNSDKRTELIVLITPRVLQTVQQASEVTGEYRRRMMGLEDMIKGLDKSRPQPSVDSDTSTQRDHLDWVPLPTTGPVPLDSIPLPGKSGKRPKK